MQIQQLNSIFLVLIYYVLEFCLFVTQQERTHIKEDQRETLKSFFKDGMTRVGSPLIPEAASATGLETCVIEVRFTLVLR